jgi:16S rRNA G966 N2-methylase RsmD
MQNIIEDVSINKIKKIFPNINKIDYTKLKITTEGLYSVSGFLASDHLCNLITKYFKTKNIEITDATANCGSDTISFSLHFKHVNSIELDIVNYNALNNNIKEYNLKNVKIYNDSSLNIIPTLKKQNCIFIDAPWTGRGYKKNINMKLFLDNKEISEIFIMFKKYSELFIFKVPVNYDFTYFIQNTNLNKYYIHSYSNIQKVIKFYYIFASTK